MIINWKDGLPAWMEASQRPTWSTHQWLASHAAMATTSPHEETITLVCVEEYIAACFSTPRETVKAKWFIYISRELIDFGDGGERDAELALERILEEQKLTIEE